MEPRRVMLMVEVKTDVSLRGIVKADLIELKGPFGNVLSTTIIQIQANVVKRESKKK